MTSIGDKINTPESQQQIVQCAACGNPFTAYYIPDSAKDLILCKICNKAKQFFSAYFRDKFETEYLTAENAERILRAEYQTDISDLASCITDAIKSGHIENRDELIEYIHETVDGCSLVIYDNQIFNVLKFSSNAEAWKEMGIELSGDNTFQQMAFCAVEQDVIEELRGEGIDVNDWEKPEPEEDEEEETEEDEESDEDTAESEVL
jgi:hypothetical protein